MGVGLGGWGVQRNVAGRAVMGDALLFLIFITILFAGLAAGAWVLGGDDE